jgi:hypothetical protein
LAQLQKALRDLMSDKLIYGRLFANGIESREISDYQIEMFSQFLINSKVIEAVYKH